MKNKDIICVSMTTWEGDYMKTIVQMMGLLARNHKVLFADYPYTWKDVFFGIFGRNNAPVSRILGLEQRVRYLQSDNSLVIHLTFPPLLPINWIKNVIIFDFLNKYNTLILRKALNAAMVENNIKKPVMINGFNPVIGFSLLSKIEVHKTIYYCYDEISAAKWAKVHGTRYEKKYLPEVDAVVTTSSGLYDTKSRIADNTYLIKNGVDFSLFNLALHRRSMDNLEVVGYLGSVDDRLDYALLSYVIRHMPETQFHFIGRITYSDGYRLLRDFSNVTFTGAQNSEQLPDHLSRFTVGIIPFVKNDFTKYIYPLKINEYMAAGIPVVATDFTDLSDFLDLITIGDSPEEFMIALKQAILHPDNEKVQERIRTAAENSWENRVEDLVQIIDQS